MSDFKAQEGDEEGEGEDIRIALAKISDELRTLTTGIKNMDERVRELEGRSAAPGAPKPAGRPVSSSAAAAGAAPAASSFVGSSSSATAPAAIAAPAKAWSAKDIVPDKYDYRQPPQDALHALKAMLDDLNAVAPVIEALDTLDLSNVQQVSNWAAANRDTIYMISQGFTARADEARRSLARIASYIDYLKEKAFAPRQQKSLYPNQ